MMNRTVQTKAIHDVCLNSGSASGSNVRWVGDDNDVELNVLGCRVNILGTNCDQCVSHDSMLLYVHRNRKAD